jgi:HK97 family phage major capsid protein
MKNKRRLLEREARIRGLGIPLLIVAGICISPILLWAILFAPKTLAGACLAIGPVALPMDQFQQKVLKGVEDMGEDIKKIDSDFESMKKIINAQAAKITALERRGLGGIMAGPRGNGPVSDACARAIAAATIIHLERRGHLSGLSESSSMREKLLDESRNALGINVKTALSTSDIPLPTEYFGEIRELISQFGVLRKAMFSFPIGMGTSKPARMGTRPAFGSIAMSGAVPEKSPTVSFASLDSHKIGGLVRLPREIDEQSFVPMGQFMARYGANEFARAEDTWGFLADGSGTYDSVQGVVNYCTSNSYSVSLASTKTHPSDATIADFRLLRTKVNKAALSAKLSAYYLDSTWEAQLRTFNTNADLYIYVRNQDGSATLDGYPIIWTDVLQPFTTSAAAAQPIAVFGALSYWWMGEHGSPRIDTSEHVFFANDQLAVRFIEEIDFDHNAADAVSALLTAAS